VTHDGPDLDECVSRRLAAADVRASSEVRAALGRYLRLLARWNGRMNLTAFDLAEPTDHAIDRLVVEPLVAARLVRRNDRVAVDIGSGGGSPALPLKIAAPQLRMVLVESRARKSAFLREAVRTLGFRDVHVETARFDAGGLAAVNGTADLVTLRAVRADADVWQGLRALMPHDGRVLWFRVADAEGAVAEAIPTDWLPTDDSTASLTVLKRRE